MTEEQIENLINKKINSNNWKTIMISTIGMVLVSAIGYIATIYTTDMQIKATQKLTKLKIDSELKKIKFNHEYNQKIKKFSSYVNSILIVDDIYSLYIDKDKIKVLNILEKVRKINEAYSNLIPYIKIDKIEEFNSKNYNLTYKLISIYSKVIEKDEISKSIDEYKRLQLEFIKDIKQNILD